MLHVGRICPSATEMTSKKVFGFLHSRNFDCEKPKLQFDTKVA